MVKEREAALKAANRAAALRPLEHSAKDSALVARACLLEQLRQLNEVGQLVISNLMWFAYGALPAPLYARSANRLWGEELELFVQLCQEGRDNINLLCS